jgi:SAM-dependent methyltransferase
LSKDDFYDSPWGAAYSGYMERPRLSRPLGRLVWGGDSRPYYESMSALAEVPDAGTVVDCPCGAGPALRALEPGRELRYLAADLSPAMLRRARRRAAKRGLGEVELVRASAESLPVEADGADLFLSYWGMHVFADPRAAVVEIARVLRPGGRLVGAALVNEPRGVRQRLLLRPHTAGFGPMCTEAELRGWLADEGLSLRAASRSGPMFFFDGRAGGGGPAPESGRSAGRLSDQQA